MKVQDIENLDVASQLIEEVERFLKKRLYDHEASAVDRDEKILYPSFAAYFVDLHNGDRELAQRHWEQVVETVLRTDAVDRNASGREAIQQAVEAATALLTMGGGWCPYDSRHEKDVRKTENIRDLAPPESDTGIPNLADSLTGRDGQDLSRRAAQRLASRIGISVNDAQSLVAGLDRSIKAREGRLKKERIRLLLLSSGSVAVILSVIALQTIETAASRASTGFFLAVLAGLIGSFAGRIVANFRRRSVIHELRVTRRNLFDATREPGR